MSKEVTIEIHKKAGKGRNSPAVYLVKRGENVVGVLEKYPDTKHEKHPWIALRAYTGELVGHYWGPNGKAMAMMAVG
jgi:hypothetical protein